MIDLKANNSDKIYLEKARLCMQKHILKEQFILIKLSRRKNVSEISQVNMVGKRKVYKVY